MAWIDDRLAADQGSPNGDARMRQALLEPLGCIYGISGKVVSLAIAELLLAADPDRGALGDDRGQHGRRGHPRAQLAAPDRLPAPPGAEHAYGPACYGPNGCAAIIE